MVHAQEYDEIPTPVFRNTSLDEPSKPQCGKTENNIKVGSDKHSLKQVRKAAVRVPSDATEDDNTVVANSVAAPTAHDPSDVTALKIQYRMIFQKNHQLNHTQNLLALWKTI